MFTLSNRCILSVFSHNTKCETCVNIIKKIHGKCIIDVWSVSFINSLKSYPYPRHFIFFLSCQLPVTPSVFIFPSVGFLCTTFLCMGIGYLPFTWRCMHASVFSSLTPVFPFLSTAPPGVVCRHLDPWQALTLRWRALISKIQPVNADSPVQVRLDRVATPEVGCLSESQMQV